MDRCSCTQAMGLHHNPRCELYGRITPDNILPVGSRSYEHDFLRHLREVNAARWSVWADGAEADPLYMANEFGGEAGEVLNVVKKLVREQRGWRGSRAEVSDLGDEIGDCIICLDSLARAYGLDLAAITAAKFNATSDKVGLPHKMGDFGQVPA